jgi:Ring finger domain
MPLRIIDDYFNPAFWCVASCCVGWVVSTISTAVFAVLGMFVYMYIFLMAPVIFPVATMVALLFIALILDYRDHLREQSTMINQNFYYHTGFRNPPNGQMINPVMREPPRIAMHPTDIASLPTFGYEKQETSECMQCTICLTAFEEGEEVKQLPRCNHLYHPRCIDQWLHRSYTCPICRDSARKDETGEFVITVD